MSSFEIILCDPVSKSSKLGGMELLEEWKSHPDAWVWLNIKGAMDEAVCELLAKQFGLPALALQDANRERHPPKLEVFDDLIFIMLRDLLAEETTQKYRVSQVSLFLGKNFLVSHHRDEAPSVTACFEAIQAQSETLKAGPAHIVYLVGRRIVDEYTPVVLNLEEKLVELEDMVFERSDDNVIELITRYSRSLKWLRRHLVYQRDVMAQLRRPAVPLPIKLNKHEYNDVFEHLERLASLCQLNHELASDLLNTHLSLASHRLNNVMRILTITTVIFLPLALLAGVYGMNFQFMPELSWHYGYFGVLTTMAAIVAALVIVFKRKGWL